MVVVLALFLGTVWFFALASDTMTVRGTIARERYLKFHERHLTTKDPKFLALRAEARVTARRHLFNSDYRDMIERADKMTRAFNAEVNSEQ